MDASFVENPMSLGSKNFQGSVLITCEHAITIILACSMPLKGREDKNACYPIIGDYKLSNFYLFMYFDIWPLRYVEELNEIF